MAVLPAHKNGVPKCGPNRRPAWCGFNGGNGWCVTPPTGDALAWFTLTGDLPQDQTKTLEADYVIPAGQSRMLTVALHSEEYPYYTGSQSQYNDILAWSVTPGGPTGSLMVNSGHEAWEKCGMTLNGFHPVFIETTFTLAAPPDTPLTLRISLTAVNIGDDNLPSTVMIGVFPP